MVARASITSEVCRLVWDVTYIDAPLVRFRDGNSDGLNNESNCFKQLYVWHIITRITTWSNEMRVLLRLELLTRRAPTCANLPVLYAAIGRRLGYLP